MDSSSHMDSAGPFEARYVAFLETIVALRPSLHRILLFQQVHDPRHFGRLGDDTGFADKRLRADSNRHVSVDLHVLGPLALHVHGGQIKRVGVDEKPDGHLEGATALPTSMRKPTRAFGGDASQPCGYTVHVLLLSETCS